jgi:hypothetical protein
VYPGEIALPPAQRFATLSAAAAAAQEAAGNPPGTADTTMTADTSAGTAGTADEAGASASASAAAGGSTSTSTGGAGRGADASRSGRSGRNSVKEGDRDNEVGEGDAQVAGKGLGQTPFSAAQPQPGDDEYGLDDEDDGFDFAMMNAEMGEMFDFDGLDMLEGEGEGGEEDEEDGEGYEDDEGEGGSGGGGGGRSVKSKKGSKSSKETGGVSDSAEGEGEGEGEDNVDADADAASSSSRLSGRAGGRQKGRTAGDANSSVASASTTTTASASISSSLNLNRKRAAAAAAAAAAKMPPKPLNIDFKAASTYIHNFSHVASLFAASIHAENRALLVDLEARFDVAYAEQRLQADIAAQFHPDSFTHHHSVQDSDIDVFGRPAAPLLHPSLDLAYLLPPPAVTAVAAAGAEGDFFQGWEEEDNRLGGFTSLAVTATDAADARVKSQKEGFFVPPRSSMSEAVRALRKDGITAFLTAVVVSPKKALTKCVLSYGTWKHVLQLLRQAVKADFDVLQKWR